MFVHTGWCVALCLAFLTYDVRAQQARPRPVEPAQLFKGGYINVTAPKTGGWFLVDSSSNGMGFARAGLARGETLAAQVLMFALTPTQTPDEFAALVKEGVEKNTDPQRFDTLESRVEYTDERPYPCARHYGVFTDKQARTSPTTTKVLRMEVHGLYCRHPVKTETGFAAVYSYRGYGTYPHLAESAKEFIQGVEVPPAPASGQ